MHAQTGAKVVLRGRPRWAYRRKSSQLARSLAGYAQLSCDVARLFLFHLSFLAHGRSRSLIWMLFAAGTWNLTATAKGLESVFYFGHRL